MVSLAAEYVASNLDDVDFLAGRSLARQFCVKIFASSDKLRSTAEPWYPYAAIQQLFMFEGLWGQAADLAVLTVQEFGNEEPAKANGFPFYGESFPVDDALLCAVLAHRSAGEYLDRALVHARSGSVLVKQLSWLRANIGSYPEWRLMSGYEGWDDPAMPVGAAYATLVANIGKAKPGQAQELWTAAYQAKNPELGAEIFARFGLVTHFWYTAAWFAGWQIRSGDVEGAQQSILTGLEIPMPFAVWDMSLPYGAVVQAQLRPAMTEDFRDEILRRRGQRIPWA